MTENPAIFIKRWFKSQHGFIVEPEWLCECINFFRGENPSISNQQLAQSAFEQCLLNDICDFCLPSLPRNIPANIHTVTGPYMLQMTKILDVSETAYDQLRRIHNTPLDEVPIENKSNHVKKKRMLKLELTDGKTTISAMEYQPIKELNTKLAPGVKIGLTGTIRCVNRVLLLENKNVKVLGGEVDTLIICNAYENVLLRILNKPLNPNPITNYEETEVREEIKLPLPKPAPPQPKPQKLTKRANSLLFDDSDEDLGDIDLDALIKQPPVEAKKNSFTHPPAVEPMDFEDLLNEDEDILDAIEQDIRREHSHYGPVATTSTVIPKSFVNNSVDYDVEMASSALVNNTLDSLAAEFTEDWIPSSQPAIPTPKKVAIVAPNNYQKPKKNLNPITVQIPSILSSNYKFRIEGLNLSTIDQLAECSSEQKLGKKFLVFAEVDSITAKLKIRNGEWNLQAFITDHSVNLLEVKFKSKVITDLCGHDAKEIEQLKRNTASQPQYREEIKDALTKLKFILETLFCFMEIFYGDNSLVIIERTITTKPNYMRILKNKIEAEKLTRLQAVMMVS